MKVLIIFACISVVTGTIYNKIKQNGGENMLNEMYDLMQQEWDFSEQYEFFRMIEKINVTHMLIDSVAKYETYIFAKKNIRDIQRFVKHTGVQNTNLDIYLASIEKTLFEEIFCILLTNHNIDEKYMGVLYNPKVVAIFEKANGVKIMYEMLEMFLAEELFF